MSRRTKLRAGELAIYALEGEIDKVVRLSPKAYQQAIRQAKKCNQTNCSWAEYEFATKVLASRIRRQASVKNRGYSDRKARK